MRQRLQALHLSIVILAALCWIRLATAQSSNSNYTGGPGSTSLPSTVLRTEASKRSGYDPGSSASGGDSAGSVTIPPPGEVWSPADAKGDKDNHSRASRGLQNGPGRGDEDDEDDDEDEDEEDEEDEDEEDADDTSDDSALSSGAIGGIVAGAALVAIAAICICCYRKGGKPQSDSAAPATVAHGEAAVAVPTSLVVVHQPPRVSVDQVGDSERGADPAFVEKRTRANLPTSSVSIQ